MERIDILVYDIETDSLNVDEADVKFFGAYSYLDEKYHLLPGTQTEEIQKLINRHSVLVGFNNKGYDDPILSNKQFNLKYKTIIDLYLVSKSRLPSMGIKLDSYKLRTIVETLKLNKLGKGDIDYNIFKQEKFSEDDLKEIYKYLKQDIEITKNLFDWFQEQFEPLKKYLSISQQNKFIHVNASLASLSYQIICNMCDLKVEWDDNKEKSTQRIEGGHHIEHRENLVKGDIVSIDLVSAYPHALIMGNLLSPNEKGWNGEDYYTINGTYSTTKQGKIETALETIFLERLKAKKQGDKIKSQAYKIVINSFYGLLGNQTFKTLYNPTSADDCTHIVRTWLKKICKTLDENGFEILYGFTDNVFVKIPKQSSKKELMIMVDQFIKEVKDSVPFPKDTFKMEVEKELKLIWFVAKNNYLFVDTEGKVHITKTLLNSKTPAIVKKVYNEYISNKISTDLDVSFTENELTNQIKLVLKDDIKLAAEQHKNVKEVSEYKTESTLPCQISKRYGTGNHLLIPNLKGIGVGKAKKYCTFDDFERNNLTIDDVDISQLMKHIKPFITKSEQETLI